MAVGMVLVCPAKSSKLWGNHRVRNRGLGAPRDNLLRFHMLRESTYGLSASNFQPRKRWSIRPWGLFSGGAPDAIVIDFFFRPGFSRLARHFVVSLPASL
jgi:hypothetical protein